MRRMLVGTALALSVVVALAGANDGHDLLDRVAGHYRNLRSFETVGHLTAVVPGTDLRIRVEARDAWANRSFAPAGSSIFKYGEAQSFGNVEITDAKGRDASNLPNLPSIRMPAHWGMYGRIDAGVTMVTQLPSEVIEAGGHAINADVIEAQYGNAQASNGRSVKYWINPRSLFVAKETFVEREGGNSWNWTYTIDSVRANQPPPKWLIEFTMANRDRAKPEFVGRTAPDFVLSKISAQDHVALATMRGKVVVLDFWATWCIPCRQEMPIVEEVAKQFRTRGVRVLAIAELWREGDSPSSVKEWLARNPSSLEVLLDPRERVYALYEGEAIPLLIVVNRKGKIVSYFVGEQSASSLRSSIQAALR